jgi:hypothetical protein
MEFLNSQLCLPSIFPMYFSFPAHQMLFSCDWIFYGAFSVRTADTCFLIQFHTKQIILKWSCDFCSPILSKQVSRCWWYLHTRRSPTLRLPQPTLEFPRWKRWKHSLVGRREREREREKSRAACKPQRLASPQTNIASEAKYCFSSCKF